MTQPARKPPIALYYDDDAFVEVKQRSPTAPAAQGAAGLMGRQVAGKEFLDAYLRFGDWEELVAVVRSRASAESIEQLCRDHPSAAGRTRRLSVVAESAFHSHFFARPGSRLLHMPCPMDEKFAWARQHDGRHAFAMSGITHTICTVNVTRRLCQMVTAPFEPYDALICISKAAVSTVRTLAANYGEYLKDRHGGGGGDFSLRVHLENIPLGVNPQRYHPPTPSERAERRRELGVADDEVVVLFVGRLSFHAKVHPFPIFDGVARAARSTGKKIHLILSGWASNEHIASAFRDGAAALAPGVRVSIVDGTQPQIRYAVWHAADIFTSLTDNIQETYSQVIIEAMSCGLPVVATDWDGCRDQVVPGQTGFLVPTYMVRAATAAATSKLLSDELSYDRFLCECNQTVSVDCQSAGAAFARLATDADLRRRMGQAGRDRVLREMTWERIVHLHEDLWQRQQQWRQDHADHAAGKVRSFVVPAIYPPPEHSFASYPMSILDAGDSLIASEGADLRVDLLLKLPLINYHPDHRSADAGVIRSVLAAARNSCPIRELDTLLEAAGLERGAGRATIGWMLKYDLLRVQGAHQGHEEKTGDAEGG